MIFHRSLTAWKENILKKHETTQINLAPGSNMKASRAPFPLPPLLKPEISAPSAPSEPPDMRNSTARLMRRILATDNMWVTERAGRNVDMGMEQNLSFPHLGK